MLGSVIAPEVILTEWLERVSHGHYAGAGGIQSYCFNAGAVRLSLFQHRSCGCDERRHVIVMRLGCVVRIFPATVKGIIRERSRQASVIAVQQADAHA